MAGTRHSPAAAAPVEEPAVAADSHYDYWAHGVAQLLTAALARDDERRRIRCPDCGRPIHDENRS